MTPLERILLRQIALDGPMTVAAYMNACLLHPEHGYYTTRDPLGAAGDFITAPEISQVFGELLGLCLAQSWLERGAPAPFQLVDLGPGRGTLLADALRATRGVPGFHAAMRLHLVEASPTLKAVQADMLAAHQPTWFANIAELPTLPLFVVANEFFDALPVRQFLRAGDAWRERVVGMADDRLTFGLTDPVSPPALRNRLHDTNEGDMVETSAPATALVAEIGQRIMDEGGVALIVDYGAEHSLGDTLQAVRAHEKRAPLDLPGQCDLTAHVAFGALRVAAPCASAPLVEQGRFLTRLGAVERFATLARAAGQIGADVQGAAFERLTAPSEMGQLFKVLALFQAGTPPPPGIEG